MKATRPLEFVCFFPVEFTTKQDGDVYVYLAMDVFSQFVFMLGTGKDREIENVLINLGKLMQHKDFLKHRDKGFTMVFHKYEEYRPAIEAILLPNNGKMVVDDLFLTKKMMPVIKEMYKFMAIQK